MTQLVAIYYDGNQYRAMAVDATGSNREVWIAVDKAVGDSDLIAIVEGARGADAFCMVSGDEPGTGNFVTLAAPIAPIEPADSGLTTDQLNAKAAAEAEAAERSRKAIEAKAAKKTKGA